MGREVILFHGSNYVGERRALGVGRYTSAQIGLGDAGPSSLRVPAGMEVLLYEGADLSGRRVVFAADTSNVGRFNHEIASVEVREAGWQPAGVSLFTEVGFAGARRVLGVGNYEAGELGIAAEGVGSLRVPAGLTVTLYERSGSRGRSVCFDADSSNIGDFKGRIASIVVARAEAGLSRSALQPRQAIVPRAQMPQQVDFRLLGQPYAMQLIFNPPPTVQDLGAVVVYRGQGYIPAPFDVAVGQLEVVVSKAEPLLFSVRFPLGPGFTAMMNRLEADLPDLAWKAVETLVEPLVPLFHNALVVISNFTQELPGIGRFIDGVTLFTRTRAHTLEPLTSIHKLFPELDLDQRDVTLALQSRNKGQPAFSIVGELEVKRALWNNIVILETLGVQFDSITSYTDEGLALGATAKFVLNFGSEPLVMRGGVRGTLGTNPSLVLWGKLAAADGVWDKPLGFPGIAITGFGVQIGLPFEVAAEGGVLIGGSQALLDAKVVVKLDLAKPIASLLRIDSKSGINLMTLLNALTKAKLNELFNIGVKDLTIGLAPFGGQVTDTYFDPGFTVKGKSTLWTWGTSLEVHAQPETGGSLNLTFDPVNVIHAGIKFISVSDAEAEVSFNPQGVKGVLKATIALGKASHTFSTGLDSNGFGIDLPDNMDIFSRGELRFENGTFDLIYGDKFGFSKEFKVANFTRTAEIEVDYDVHVRASKDGFWQQLSFSYTFLGEKGTIGPIDVDLPFRSLNDVRKEIEKFFKVDGLKWLLDVLRNIGEAAFKWFKGTAEEAAKFFKKVGVDPSAIGKHLGTLFGVSPEDAVKFLGAGAQEAAKILKDLGRPPAEIAKYLGDVGGFAEDVIYDALGSAGISKDAVNDAMGKAFGGGWVSGGFSSPIDFGWP